MIYLLHAKFMDLRPILQISSARCASLPRVKSGTSIISTGRDQVVMNISRRPRHGETHLRSQSGNDYIRRTGSAGPYYYDCHTGIPPNASWSTVCTTFSWGWFNSTFDKSLALITHPKETRYRTMDRLTKTTWPRPEQRYYLNRLIRPFDS